MLVAAVVAAPSPALAQGESELRAHPSALVVAAPIGEASGAAGPDAAVSDTALPDALPDAAALEAAASAEAAAAAARDPLYELVVSRGDLSVEEADALLHEAYDAYPTPTSRSRAFAIAAVAASGAERHELAIAWMDWAIREAEDAPERDALLADRLGEAIGVALSAGHPVLARDYARRAAASLAGWSDIADRRSVRFEALALECPDVVDDAFIRTAAVAERVGEGVLAAVTARCDYVPIIGPRGEGFGVQAVRSHMDVEERTHEVVEDGLDAEDVEARRVIGRRLSELETVVEQIFFEDGRGYLGYARHTRAGVNDIASFAYATASRDGVFYASSASGPVWDWRPTVLGERAETGLRAVLDAR